MAQLITSAAPHVHSGDSVQKNMLLVILALLPAFVVSVIAFGWGALITTCISIVACVLTEWCITKYMLKREPSLLDLSAVLTGLLLAMNLPSNLPWWMVVLGSVFAIGIGKMVFGGLGQNVFNPALVGRVFLLISFPAAMTTWPVAKGFATKYLRYIPVVHPRDQLAYTCIHPWYSGCVLSYPECVRYRIGSVDSLAHRRYHVGCYLYGNGLCDQPDGCMGKDYLRYRHRRDSCSDPYLGFVSRRYVVCYPDHERLCTIVGRLRRSEAFRRSG